MTHDTLPNKNPRASGGNGAGGQSLRLGSVEAVRGNRPFRAGSDARMADAGDEKVSKATLIWYALTVPFRLCLVFACAVTLIAGICFLSVCGGER